MIRSQREPVKSGFLSVHPRPMSVNDFLSQHFENEGIEASNKLGCLLDLRRDGCDSGTPQVAIQCYNRATVALLRLQ